MFQFPVLFSYLVELYPIYNRIIILGTVFDQALYITNPVRVFFCLGFMIILPFIDMLGDLVEILEG